MRSPGAPAGGAVGGAPRGILLAPALLVLLYAAYGVWSIRERGLFEYVGIDYRVYRTAGEIAREHGFRAVYDLSLQEEHQRPLVRRYASGRSPLSMSYSTNQSTYLPVFQVPFLAIPLFEPVTGYVLWTVGNALVVVVFALLLLRSAGRACAAEAAAWLLASFPLFANLLVGQVSGWLFAFLAGHLLAARRGRDFRAGLWLAGLLLKPQMLVILAPGLLVARRWRTLAGLAAGSAAALLASVALAGFQGLADMAVAQADVVRGAALTFPGSMINWRAAALLLVHVLPAEPTWVLAALGMAVTFALGLGLWRRPVSVDGYPLVLVGTCAATFVVSWHSHVHMAIALQAPLLLLAAQAGIPRALVAAWAAPGFVFVPLAFLVSPDVAHTCAGLMLFGVSLAHLWWSVSRRASVSRAGDADRIVRAGAT